MTTATRKADAGMQRTHLARTAVLTSLVGGSLFVLGTALHPGREGHDVAAVGDRYGVTHGLQAIALIAMAIALASMLALVTAAAAPSRSWHAALVGTVTWFGLIVYDGAVNPVTARYAPELVHAGESLDPMGSIIVLPALVLFPLGYVLLAIALGRIGLQPAGVLLAAGSVIYTAGGYLIFAVGPDAELIQPLEVAGAASLALGFAVLARAAHSGRLARASVSSRTRGSVSGGGISSPSTMREDSEGSTSTRQP